MRSRDFAVLVCNRIEVIGVCLFCDEYERMPWEGHASSCPVTEYLRAENARRGDKTTRDRNSKMTREGKR